MDSDEKEKAEPAQNEAAKESNEAAKESGDCGPGCGCGAAGGTVNGMKLAVCLAMALAAAVVIARGFMKNAPGESDGANDTFAAALPADGPEPADGAGAVGDAWGKPLKSLAELDKVAGDTDAVLVFVPSKDDEGSDETKVLMKAAAEKIRIRTRGARIGLHILDRDAKHYAEITEKTPAPCVVALVKGGGSSVAGDGITEKKILQAYINASRRPAACCPPGAKCD